MFQILLDTDTSVEMVSKDRFHLFQDNGRTIEVFAGKLLKTDLKDSSSNLSSTEETDGNEMKDFALNCLLVKFTIIFIHSEMIDFYKNNKFHLIYQKINSKLVEVKMTF